MVKVFQNQAQNRAINCCDTIRSSLDEVIPLLALTGTVELLTICDSIASTSGIVECNYRN